MPANLPEPRDRESLAKALAALGRQLLHELGDPTVIAVFRLAIAEAVRAPEVAGALDGIGGKATRAAVLGLMDRAQSAGLLRGDPAEMADRFAGLLWGNLMLRLLLGVAIDRTPARSPDAPATLRRPSSSFIHGRARPVADR